MSQAGRVGVAVATVLLAAGCGDAGDGDDPTAEPSGRPGPVGQGVSGGVAGDFSADVVPARSAGAGVLEVSYTWTNRSDQPVLAVDRPRESSGAAPAPSPTAWYAVGVGEDVVQISQRVFDLPDDAPDYAQGFQVGFTLVQPGGTLRRELVIPMPVTEAKPFAGVEAGGERAIGDPARAQFCLGVLVPPYAEGLVDDSEDGLVGFHRSTDRQALFCSETVALD